MNISLFLLVCCTVGIAIGDECEDYCKETYGDIDGAINYLVAPCDQGCHVLRTTEFVEGLAVKDPYTPCKEECSIWYSEEKEIKACRDGCKRQVPFDTQSLRNTPEHTEEKEEVVGLETQVHTKLADNHKTAVDKDDNVEMDINDILRMVPQILFNEEKKDVADNNDDLGTLSLDVSLDNTDSSNMWNRMQAMHDSMMKETMDFINQASRNFPNFPIRNSLFGQPMNMPQHEDNAIDNSDGFGKSILIIRMLPVSYTEPEHMYREGQVYSVESSPAHSRSLFLNTNTGRYILGVCLCLGIAVLIWLALVTIRTAPRYRIFNKLNYSEKKTPLLDPPPYCIDVPALHKKPLDINTVA